jgi:hypothetical protein
MTHNPEMTCDKYRSLSEARTLDHLKNSPVEVVKTSSPSSRLSGDSGLRLQSADAKGPPSFGVDGSFLARFPFFSKPSIFTLPTESSMNLVEDGPLPVLESSLDEQLARRVRNFLETKLVRGPLALEVQGGQVTLRGCVRSFYHKQLLIHGAQRVAGVRRVIDELLVVDSQPSTRSVPALEPT